MKGSNLIDVCPECGGEVFFLRMVNYCAIVCDNEHCCYTVKKEKGMSEQNMVEQHNYFFASRRGCVEVGLDDFMGDGYFF